MLTLIFVTAVVGYGVLIVVMRPATNKSSEAGLIRLALKNLGVEKPAWNTLMITATRDVRLPIDSLWEAWSNIEDWPLWSSRHASANWKSDTRWQVGSQFEQVLNLGFPLGRKRITETLSEVNPGRRVRWSKTNKNTKSCHIWSFTLLPNRQVRLTSTEVFHGTYIGLLKPMLILQWQKPLERSMDALIRLAKVCNPPCPSDNVMAAEAETAA
jgi:uncharacterized protein YndB with AHSA1/START domain